MKVYIQKTIDYTLKRKGEAFYTIVDEQKTVIGEGGCWKTKKAAIERVNEKGWSFEGMLPTVHQNYGHWAGFQFAK